MFRGIAFLIILWGISLFFGDSMVAFDRAATETFRTIELSAVVTQQQLEQTPK